MEKGVRQFVRQSLHPVGRLQSRLDPDALERVRAVAVRLAVKGVILDSEAE